MSEIQNRKKDHIELALASQMNAMHRNSSLTYEPALGHQGKNTFQGLTIAGKQVKAPFWISSMTGGTVETGEMNKVLAAAANKLDAAMGLGSCRIALEDPKQLPFFQVRKELGDHLPLFANLGIAELEMLVNQNQLFKLQELVKATEADGLIIHINPLQELLQPEGACHRKPPLDSLKSLLDVANYPIIVKEVGQGFGPQSLNALLSLPLEAIELAGFGGTNFSKVEILRSKEKHPSTEALSLIGHNPLEMLHWLNASTQIRCKNIIISGGVKNAIEGYHYNSLCKLPSLYGIASRLLQPAQTSLESLIEYLTIELKSYNVAADFLTLKEN